MKPPRPPTPATWNTSNRTTAPPTSASRKNCSPADSNRQALTIPLRNMRAEAEIFRQENIPLQTEVSKLGMDYDRIAGAQSVEWQGEDKTLAQAYHMLSDLDRDQAEALWRLIADRHLQDRERPQRPVAEDAQSAPADRPQRRLRKLPRLPVAGFWPLRLHPGGLRRPSTLLSKRWSSRQPPVSTSVWPLRSGVDHARPWDMQRDNVYPPALPTLHPYDASGAPGTRRRGASSSKSTLNWAIISASCAAKICSIWPIAKAKRPAATAPISRSPSGLSSS